MHKFRKRKLIEASIDEKYIEDCKNDIGLCPILGVETELTVTPCCDQNISKEALYRIQIKFEDYSDPKCPYCKNILERINKRIADNKILNTPITFTTSYLINIKYNLINWYRECYIVFIKEFENFDSIMENYIDSLNINYENIKNNVDIYHLAVDHSWDKFCEYKDNKIKELNNFIETSRNDIVTYFKNNNLKQDLPHYAFTWVSSMMNLYKIKHNIPIYKPSVKKLSPVLTGEGCTDDIMFREIILEDVRCTLFSEIIKIMNNIRDRFLRISENNFYKKIAEIYVRDSVPYKP